MAMQPDIDTDLLRSFVAVADGGGFTRAARLLNRTQSAVSMQIKRLEAQTGAILFDRAGRAVRLTRAGEALLGYARQILALNERALSALSGIGLSGTVRLGAMDDYATWVLPDILARFAHANPLVYVEVHTGLSAELLKQLGRSLDLVLAMHPERGATGEVLRVERAVWAAAAHRDLHHRDPLPLALYPRGCLFRRWALEALDQTGRAWRMSYMSPSLAAVAEAVRAGLAISVFKRSLLPRDLRVLGEAEGLPKLPSAEIALHRASDRPSAAVAELALHLRRGLHG
jgi:DNA-binding transcriptional LysR family regulator